MKPVLLYFAAQQARGLLFMLNYFLDISFTGTTIFFLNDIHLLMKIYVSDPYGIATKMKRITLTIMHNNKDDRPFKVD